MSCARHRRGDCDRCRSDGRVFPVERAVPPKRERAAWKRIEPDLSGGYAEIHEAMGCDLGVDPDEVTSS